MPSRKIYLLSPKKFAAETIAVTFAKTSRSPESFEQIASELSDEKSAKFHEKWVVGYGHASVAEHAVLHIAIENVSRLAVESIEANRLASYTEKSTRYQKWTPDAYVIPPELDGHPLVASYKKTCNHLFTTYAQCIISVKEFIKAQLPPHENESDEAYDRRVLPGIIDSCRFLLPAAASANLGMTANARVLEHAISKLLSDPLSEVRQIGEEIKETAQGEVPTLVKYAHPSAYLSRTLDDFRHLELKINKQVLLEGQNDWCRLISFDPDGEIKVLAATLYRSSEMSFPEAEDLVLRAGVGEKQYLAHLLLGQMDKYDTPLRELEHTSYTFDLTLDQGAYAEFKRHRMMTQTPQPLTARLGYAIPRLLVQAGYEARYRKAMEIAAETYESVALWDPHVAAYLVPNGFQRRVLFTMNLREAFSFCRLRAAPKAHFSMRRVAQRIAEEIRKVHPLLGKYINMPEESWQEVESLYL